MVNKLHVHDLERKSSRKHNRKRKYSNVIQCKTVHATVSCKNSVIVNETTALFVIV